MRVLQIINIDDRQVLVVVVPTGPMLTAAVGPDDIHHPKNHWGIRQCRHWLDAKISGKRPDTTFQLFEHAASKREKRGRKKQPKSGKHLKWAMPLPQQQWVHIYGAPKLVYVLLSMRPCLLFVAVSAEVCLAKVPKTTTRTTTAEMMMTGQSADQFTQWQWLHTLLLLQ